MGSQWTEGGLRALSATYAAGVDRRDAALFLSAFTVDAVLTVHRQDVPASQQIQLRGHEQLTTVVEKIAFYPQTFHVLGQSLFRTDKNRVLGETYCVAHHLKPVPAGHTDLVMYLRYQDEYANGLDGRWLIQDRAVQVEWLDETTVAGRAPIGATQ